MTASFDRWRTRAIRFADTLRAVRHEQGNGAAIRLAARLLTALVTRPWTMFQEYRLDRRLGIETRRESGLTAEAEASAVHVDSVSYQATPSRTFARLIASLPVGSRAGYTFVDLGCGKGRTIVMAALHGFGRVVGVELDPDLIGVARANVASFQARAGVAPSPIDLVQDDAARYRLPDGPLVVYLHNPFGDETMRDVVDNIEAAWQEHPRHMVVAYFNPVHRDVFDSVSLLTQAPVVDPRWTVYATPDPRLT